MAITNFVPEIWSAALLTNFKAAETVAPLVNRQYEGEARQGNQVNITGITTPTVQDYAAGASSNPHTHTVDDLSDSTTALLINQEDLIAFKVDDVDATQAAGSFDVVTMDSAAALVEKAEGYILGRMLTEGTNANPDPDGAGSGTAVTVDSADKAYAAVGAVRTALSKAKAPMTDRYMVVNPEFAELLLASGSKLVSADAGPENEIRNGVIGRMLGFTVVESPLLNASGSNAGKPSAIGFHRSSVAYVNQIQTVEALRAQNSVADIVRMLHVYGAKVLRTTSVQYYVSL